MIADASNHRVIEVNRERRIVWQMTGLYRYPDDARKLPNGNLLITVSENNRVLEVNVSNNSIVWEYDKVNRPWGAFRKKDCNILIADTNNNRVIEVDYHKNILWEYKGLNRPASVIELNNGNILISDRYNHRVFETNKDNVILWQYGKTGAPGGVPDYLNQPFSAEEVGSITLGSIIGKVTRAGSDFGLPNVKIRAIQDGIEKGLTTTLSDGSFYLDLLPGTYTIEASILDFNTQTLNNIVVLLGKPTKNVNLELVLLEPRMSNIIIADIVNGRVLEVDSDKNIVWEYTGLNAPVEARRLANGNVLITEHFRHRVIEVDRDKNIIWQYGITDNLGSGYNQLNHPVRASRLSNGNTLIADSNNHRVIEVNRERQIVWQMTGLHSPYDATKLENDNVLIADTGNDRIIEVNVGNNNIVWKYESLNSPNGVYYRKKNGHILIADTENNRVIEVDYHKNILWEYKGLNRPVSVIELNNGNILISDRNNHCVFETNKDNRILWQYGKTGAPGGVPDYLNQPFSAEEVGSVTLGSIIGKVVRAVDGKPLTGVTVNALQNAMVKGSTTTFSDGTYIIDLKPGTYTLQAIILGYGSQTKGNIKITLAKSTKVDFVLTDIFQHTPAYLLYTKAPGDNGLIGEYYDNADLTNLKLVRTDANINFDWGNGSPHASIGSDVFSIRWTGWLKVEYEDTYTFYAASDNGVRLWIDDKLVIDDWNNVVGERTGSIQLMKGFYPIKLEYFDGGGPGAIRLYWSSTSISKSIITSDNSYESWYTYPLNAYPVKIKLLGSEYQIDPSSLNVYYKINDITMWNSIPLSSTGVDYEYLALIPQQIAGTKVYYYIEGKDLAGNIITSPTERPRLTPYKFKVVALSIISTTPKDKAMNVSVASNIKIVFSDSIDPATIGTNTIKVMVGTFTVDGVYSYNNADKTVTFEPTGGLKEKTKYTVIITTKVMDTASNTIPIEYAFSFWTDLLGNLDEYTRVDGRDLVILGRAFGSTPEDVNWLPEADFNKEDDSRNRIDSRDLALLASRFGRSSSLSPVPKYIISSQIPLITGNPTIKLISSKMQVLADEEITLDIIIDNVLNVYSWGADLIFDPSKFEVLEVKQGPFLSQDRHDTSFLHAIKQDRIIMGGGRLGQINGISGSGVLAKIILMAKEKTPVKFALEKIAIEDSNLCLLKEIEIINLDSTNEQATQPEFKIFCYPNPAKDKVIFRFDLPKAGDVEIKIYNIAGELIKRVTKQGLHQGTDQEIIWQPIDVASGVYIYVAKAKYNTGESKKVIGKLGIVK